MKIKAIALSLLLGTAAVNAQIAPTTAPQTPGASETTQSGSGLFKPESGNVTLELNMSPFGANPISLSYIRARLFLSDDLALRAGFSVGMNSSADVDASTPGQRTETDISSFRWAILPGIEKHFAGTERLSPYIGGEVIVAGQSASYESVTTFTDNSPSNTSTVKGDNGSQDGYFSFGVGAVAGCDFYFAKRIYMGLEAGFGLTTNALSDVTTTNTSGSTSTSVVTERGSTMQFGPSFNSAIRIGFVF